MHMVAAGNYENVVPGWSREGRPFISRQPHPKLASVELATGREAQVT
jgi:hypothetical protein